jgi:hypothetical protein
MDFEKMALVTYEGGKREDDILRWIEDALRAAFAAGREAMRESAGKVVDGYADDCGSRDCCEVYSARQAKDIARAIRALSGEEG